MTAHTSHVGIVALLRTIQELRSVLPVVKPAPTAGNSTIFTKSVGLPQLEPPSHLPQSSTMLAQDERHLKHARCWLVMLLYRSS